MNGLALCAGYDGIGLGLSLVEPSYRTVCVVEIEAFAAALLVDKMEAGALAPAPVWGDLGSFDGRRWRGCVDIVHAGIPCQPYSVAGKRGWNEDKRAIWPEFARIVGECRPALAFIENVPAFVVDGGFRPLGEELSRLGYTIEEPFFCGAEDLGAPHGRSRVFILAYAQGSNWRLLLQRRRPQQEGAQSERGGQEMAARLGDAERGGPQSGDENGATTEVPGPRCDFVAPFPPPMDADDAWLQIVKSGRVDIAPAHQPGVRGVADGSPLRVDRNRIHGNGVVPLQVARAYVELADRLGQ